MTASTVSRQLGTLVAARLVERVPETGRYRLGIRLVEPATPSSCASTRRLARPHLEALVEVGETATLSVPGEP